jgi:hypothetical protein
MTVLLHHEIVIKASYKRRKRLGKQKSRWPKVIGPAAGTINCCLLKRLFHDNVQVNILKIAANKWRLFGSNVTSLNFIELYFPGKHTGVFETVDLPQLSQ